jgi:hypothetical protein
MSMSKPGTPYKTFLMTGKAGTPAGGKLTAWFSANFAIKNCFEKLNSTTPESFLGVVPISLKSFRIIF